MDIFIYYSAWMQHLPTALIIWVCRHLVAEMGVGHRINNAYCQQLIDGIFNLMIHSGKYGMMKHLQVSRQPISFYGRRGQHYHMLLQEAEYLFQQLDSYGNDWNGNAYRRYY